MPNDVVIVRRLDVLGTDKVLVPGCEPTSTVTSATLFKQQSCKNFTVPLQQALDAIPGSKVEFGTNWGDAGPRKRWFVLPQVPQGCCNQVDYYRVLRDLDGTEPQLE